MSAHEIDVRLTDPATAEISEQLAVFLVQQHGDVPQFVLAEAAVRALALIIAACAKPGNRAATLRLGASMLEQLADLEPDGRLN